MRKKTDVDIYEELSKLVDTHVKHYKEDFDLDQRLIMQAAKSELPEDRTLIWFCRECGTQCLRESQTFVRDTREHTTLRFYAEQSGEAITARIIVPKSVKGKKVMGDVYEVNFRDLANKVAQDSISPAMTRMAFADGFEQEVPFHNSLRQAEVLVQEHGKIASLHVIPVDMPVDRMPDESVTVDDMKAYGYAWGGMLPMREEAAAEVMKSCTVFRLYGDNTESRVQDASELKDHAQKGGLFGVEKVEWKAALERENYLKSAEMSTEDDYGMIDGIINNGSKEDKSAERSSKSSIMDRLKAAKSEPQKDKPTPHKEPKKDREL